MADTAIGLPTAGAGALRRRRALPNGRAVVGGLLVSASAVGMFVVWSTATTPPTTRYVVAARDIAPGERLTLDDLRLATMELPPGLAADGAFGDPSLLVGAALVGPLNAGELVQEGTVTSVETAAGELELSFAIEASRAVGGTLRPGEAVDVLATFGAGGDTYTTTVVAGARVLRVDGDRGTQTIAVAVRSADDARAITHATNAGQVVVVRATATGDAPRAGTYRAPSSGHDGHDGA